MLKGMAELRVSASRSTKGKAWRKSQLNDERLVSIHSPVKATQDVHSRMIRGYRSECTRICAIWLLG